MNEKDFLKQYIKNICGQAHSKYRQDNFWNPKSDKQLAEELKTEFSSAINSLLENQTGSLSVQFSDYIIKLIDFCETRDIFVIDKILK